MTDPFQLLDVACTYTLGHGHSKSVLPNPLEESLALTGSFLRGSHFCNGRQFRPIADVGSQARSLTPTSDVGVGGGEKRREKRDSAQRYVADYQPQARTGKTPFYPQ